MHASVQELGLMTFDADGTLYADGTHMDHDNEMINHIITLMKQEVSSHVEAVIAKELLAHQNILQSTFGAKM